MSVTSTLTTAQEGRISTKSDTKGSKGLTVTRDTRECNVEDNIQLFTSTPVDDDRGVRVYPPVIHEFDHCESKDDGGRYQSDYESDSMVRIREWVPSRMCQRMPRSCE